MQVFMTMLASDDYLEGVLVLNESLKRVDSKYPLVVLMTKKLDSTTLDSLTRNKIKFIEYTEDIKLPDLTRERNSNQGVVHWNNTFGKLKVFGMDTYEKIVYLDSDMMVVENIDFLFTCPHLSAVVAGRMFRGNEDWVELNSGLMVIEPNKDLERKLIGYLPICSVKRDKMGDQEVIQEYHIDWKSKKELLLDDGYNMFVGYMDYYSDKHNYSYKGYGGKNDSDTKPIAVIHFILKRKPWMYTRCELYIKYAKHLFKGRVLQLKALMDYQNLLMEIRKSK